MSGLDNHDDTETGKVEAPRSGIVDPNPGPIRCPNCRKVVRYGSEHTRGRDHRNCDWTCKAKKG